MSKPEIMKKAEDALDFLGISYEWEDDTIRASSGILIWTENGRQLKAQPYAVAGLIDAVIKKMEVLNGK